MVFLMFEKNTKKVSLWILNRGIKTFHLSLGRALSVRYRSPFDIWPIFGRLILHLAKNVRVEAKKMIEIPEEDDEEENALGD